MTISSGFEQLLEFSVVDNPKDMVLLVIETLTNSEPNPLGFYDQMNPIAQAQLLLELFTLSESISDVAKLIPLTNYTAPGGQQFTVIGPTPLPSYIASLTTYQGESDWILQECRSGDKTTNDSPTNQRTGLDGFPTKFPLGAHVHADFYYIPVQGIIATSQGHTNFCEVHTTAIPGDIEQSGPFTWEADWSAGLSKPVLRLNLNTVVKDGNGLVTGKGPTTILYQGDASNQGPMKDMVKEHFAYDYFEHATNGYIRVWRNGTQIVNYSGPVGYGGARVSYPQFRIYGSYRTVTAKSLTKIVDLSYI